MDILLVLAGVLLGIAVTLGVQTVRVWYFDWRRTRDWALAGRRWKEILDHITTDRRTVWAERSAEERLADLQRRVAMIVTGEPIDDFDKQLAYINEHPERLPEHELEEHRERAEARERAYADAPGFESRDLTPAVESFDRVNKFMRDLQEKEDSK